MWPKLDAAFLKPFPKAGGSSVLPPGSETEADAWAKSLESLLAIRSLEDDWDGQGTEAPSPEVVDSAMILAVMLRERDVRPPTVTVQGVNGDVGFEWQWEDRSTLSLDVTEPYEADLFSLPTGRPSEHYSLRQTVAVS